jgi:hypothetical protein
MQETRGEPISCSNRMPLGETVLDSGEGDAGEEDA